LFVSLPEATYRDQEGKSNMNTTIVDSDKSTVEQVVSQVVPSWKTVYRVGGVCLLLFGLIYLTEITLSIFMGGTAPADSVQYLRSLADHANLARLSYGLYSFADILFVPAVLALYLSLKRIAKNPMLLATALIAVFVIVDLAITEASALTIVTLTQHAATAASETQRAAYMASANYALATVPLATFYSWVISSVGVLMISIVMLKGVFSKLTAYIGIAVGIAGTVASFYVFVPALTVLNIPTLVAFGLWCVLAGRRLYQLGKSKVAGETASVTAE
jgi:hypothetical protein